MSHLFKKTYGQNFLRSKKFAYRLAEIIDAGDGDVVLEIGPGEGVLTSVLIDRGAKVISVEIDYSLLPNLVKRFPNTENFELINSDILEVDFKETFNRFIQEGNVKVTGSLPYNISKKIISNLIDFNHSQKDLFIEKMSFIVQEEVAQSYASAAPKATLLTNILRLHAEVRKLESIPASQFFPAPKVNGAILLIEPRRDVLDNKVEIIKLMRVGFISPRKTLINNLKNSRKWNKESIESAFQNLNISTNARAAELEFDLWVKLFNQLKIES